MAKKSKKTLIITTMILIFTMGLLMYCRNNYGGSPKNIFNIFLVLILYNVVVNCALSTRTVSINAAKTLLNIGKWSMVLFGIIYFIMSEIDNIKQYLFDKEMICSLFVGIILIIVGNYFPKNRINRFVGLKFPWLLTDEDGWKKTHQVGAYTWILAGIIMMIHPLHRITTLTTVFLLILVIVIPMVYSIIIHIINMLGRN